MSDRDTLFISILFAALTGCGILICHSYLLRPQKIKIENQIDDKKRELVGEHLPSSQKKSGDASELHGQTNHSTEVSETVPSSPLEAIDFPASGQNDFTQINQMGDFLCKADESCRSLLDHLQTLLSIQELNDHLLTYGALPITMIVLLSLGLGGNHSATQQLLKKVKEMENKLGNVKTWQKQAGTMEEVVDGVKKLYKRVESLEKKPIIV